MAGMQKDGRTVFVRGISFDLDDKPFEEVFSNVGPVKQCFLVRTKGEPRHKGFGFVQYALQEDAARAVEQLNGQAISGRKLMVELANKRAPLGERKRKRTDGTAEPDTPSTPAIAIDAVPSNSSVPAAAKPPAERRSQKTGQEAAQVQIHAGGAQPPKRAAKNPKPGQGAAATAPAARSTAVDAVTAQKRHRLMRTVAVGGLTRESVAAALAVARKAGQVEEVEDPAPEEAVSRARLTADGCSGHVLLVTYPTVQEAVQAVMKLHGLKLRSPAAAAAAAAGAHPGGKAQKQQAAGGSEAAAGAEGGAGDLPVRVWARQMAGEGAHVRKWRVIVRNLAFKASEAQVKAVLGQAGFVWEVTLPRGPDGRSKGFAFATFMTRAHAEKAIQLCNAKEIAGRPVAVDWALAKSQYQQAGAVGASGAGADGARSPSPAPHDEQLGSEELDDGGDEDTDGDEDDDDDDDDDGEEEEEEGEEDEEEEEGSEEGKEEEGEEEEEDVVGATMGGRGVGSGAGMEEEQSMLASVLQGVLSQLHDPEEAAPSAAKDPPDHPPTAAKAPTQAPGKAVLIGQAGAGAKPAAQGSAAAASEAGGKGSREGDGDKEGQGQAEAGKARAAPSAAAASQAVSCTVFVRGLPLDITQVALQAKLEAYGRVRACRLVMDKASGKPKGTAFVEFKDPDSARRAADACARGRQGKGPGVELGGRALEVDLAVTQDQARKLAAEQAKDRTHRGKDSRNLFLAKEGEIPVGSAAWQAMSEHDREKRQRGAEDKRQKLRSPNFVVSATRLSIRNIPFTMTEAQLRSLALRAVKAHASKEKPDVLQVKILREEEGGKTGKDGKPRSKGMGFIEFSAHDHAVACLRQLNNNPDAFVPERRPIVEFAIDNVKVLKKLEAIRAKHQQNQLRQQEGRGPDSLATGADAREGSAQKRPRLAGEPMPADADAEAAPTLTLKQQKRLKAKAKMERRKQRRKGVQQQEGSEASVPAPSGTAPTAPQPKGMSEKQQPVKPASTSAEAGSANEQSMSGAPPASGAGPVVLSKRAKMIAQRQARAARQQGGQQQPTTSPHVQPGTFSQAGTGKGGYKQASAGKSPAPTVTKPATTQQPRGGQQRGVATLGQASKRRRDEYEDMDRIAAEGLVGRGTKRAARRGDEEKKDRLDQLAAQYKDKLSGDKPIRSDPHHRQRRNSAPAQDPTGVQGPGTASANRTSHHAVRGAGRGPGRPAGKDPIGSSNAQRQPNREQGTRLKRGPGSEMPIKGAGSKPRAPKAEGQQHQQVAPLNLSLGAGSLRRWFE